MDITIRNLDARLYRKIRARAAAEGKTVGSLLNAAMENFLALPRFEKKHGSIFDLPAFDPGPSAAPTSEHVDDILYGEPR